MLQHVTRLEHLLRFDPDNYEANHDDRLGLLLLQHRLLHEPQLTLV